MQFDLLNIPTVKNKATVLITLQLVSDFCCYFQVLHFLPLASMLPDQLPKLLPDLTLNNNVTRQHGSILSSASVLC
jgi:hypothetical protein